MKKKMVNTEDINKKCIVLVRDRSTGNLVWMNFDFKIKRVYENGNVLVENEAGTTHFRREEVRAIHV